MDVYQTDLLTLTTNQLLRIDRILSNVLDSVNDVTDCEEAIRRVLGRRKAVRRVLEARHAEKD
jgi:hypothetical protein